MLYCSHIVRFSGFFSILVELLQILIVNQTLFSRVDFQKNSSRPPALYACVSKKNIYLCKRALDIYKRALYNYETGMKICQRALYNDETGSGCWSVSNTCLEICVLGGTNLSLLIYQFFFCLSWYFFPTAIVCGRCDIQWWERTKSANLGTDRVRANLLLASKRALHVRKRALRYPQKSPVYPQKYPRYTQ